jgi:hypothetical protein
MTKAEAGRIYRKAAEVLEIRGWNQGAFFELDGSCCAVGALMVASGYEPTVDSGKVKSPEEVSKELAEFYCVRELGRLTETDVTGTKGGLVYYNDYRAKNKDQVQSALRAIADRMESAA